MKSIFITATDTEVGKTTIASGIISGLIKQSSTPLRVAGFKPIAAGCEVIDGELKNEDALSLIQAGNSQFNSQFNYQQVNPFALKAAIAPHIAAKQQGVSINSAQLDRHYQNWQQTELDYLIIEGAGGWQLPINDTEYLSDWVVSQQIPVILVVGLKLGCINHALLSAMAIAQMGGQLVGWVANHVDPKMQCQTENLQALTQRLKVPCLGTVPYLTNEQSAESFIDLEQLKSLTA